MTLANDFSDPNTAKDATRRANIGGARDGAPILWSRLGDCLRVDWLELCGHRAPTCTLLRQSNALGRGKFIGVDGDPEAIRSSREANGDEHGVWIVGDLFELIADRDPRIDGVGVLNYDSFDGVSEIDEENLERLYSLFTFARRQQERLSAFLLILNLANPPHRKLASSAARLARLLAEHTGRPWTADDVLAHKYTSRTLAMFNIPIKFGFLHLDQRRGVSP